MAEQEKPKEECPKKECCKKEFKGFHGFGPRCNARGFPPMFGPPCHPHKHKERKCECGEVIPKRKEGEPKVRVCPKCKKELPKKHHGFGMRCHKMKKMMKFMQMMNMWQQPCMGPQGFGPECWGQTFPPCPPPPRPRGLEVHHYIHFGPPSPPPFEGPCGRPPCGPCGRPPFEGP